MLNINQPPVTTMKKLASSICVFGFCIAILLPHPATAVPPAAYLTIDDSSPAETITVSWSGFINSVLLNSVVQPSAGSITFNESVVNTINFAGMWNSGGLAIAPTYVDFYEDATLTTVSDNLVYSVGAGPGISTFNVTFTSDVEGGGPLSPQPGPAVIQFVEQLDGLGNPVPYQVNYQTLQPLFFSVTSAPEPVPEPSVIAFGFLGAFLGIQRWHRRPQTPTTRTPSPTSAPAANRSSDPSGTGPKKFRS